MRLSCFDIEKTGNPPEDGHCWSCHSEEEDGYGAGPDDIVLVMEGASITILYDSCCSYRDPSPEQLLLAYRMKGEENND